MVKSALIFVPLLLIAWSCNSTTSDSPNYNEPKPSKNSSKRSSSNISNTSQTSEANGSSLDSNRGANRRQNGETGEPLYLDSVTPILNRHCVQCHNSNGTNPDLTNEATIISQGEKIVRSTATNVNGMPKLDADLNTRPEDVTQDEKDILNLWKTGGYKK